jgi:integrase
VASLFKPTYTATDKKTGKKVQRKAKKWYGQWKDADGVLRREPLATDKTAAQQLLNGKVRESDRERAGLGDPFKGYTPTPLPEHLKDFKAFLLNKGNTEFHCEVVTNRATWVMEGCGFRFIPDISASQVQQYLADLKDGGSAQQTVNFYLRAAKQFCRWLVRDKRTNESRLQYLEGGNVNLDIRRKRRELSSDEIGRLLKATREGKPYLRFSGLQRFMLYATALGTGLRASELASLTTAHFDLDAELPIVEIFAADEKARRGDVIPLPPDLVEQLRPWIAGMPLGASLWPGRWAEHRYGGRLLARDMEAARNAWLEEAETAAEKAKREKLHFLKTKNEDGEQADFHALRHTYLSRLGRSGASAKVMQKLARHSTVELTLGRYTHAGLFDLASAVNELPILPTEAKRDEPPKLSQTG